MSQRGKPFQLSGKQTLNGISNAIIAITSMILVSIHPFAFRKIFLILAALLCFSALCFADPVLMAERYVPRPGSCETFETDASPTVGPGQNSQDGPGVQRRAKDGAFRPVDWPSPDQRSLHGLKRTSEPHNVSDDFPSQMV